MDFTKKPSDVVELKSGPVSYIDYYSKNYEITIRDGNQPPAHPQIKAQDSGKYGECYTDLQAPPASHTTSAINLPGWTWLLGLGPSVKLHATNYSNNCFAPSATSSTPYPVLRLPPKTCLLQLERQIHLVPEVCYMTGLKDNIRKDFRIMQDLAQYTR